MKTNDFDKYQKNVEKTAIYPGIGKNFIYPTIGLVGEAGEIANKVKKVIRDDKSKIDKKNREELAYELGDVMWYIAQLSTELDLKLSKIIKMNIMKLAKRMKSNTLHGSGDHR